MRTSANRSDPIAIVGIGCRFPGGASHAKKFWSLLMDGFDAIKEVPKTRWDSRRFYDPDPQASGKMYVNKAGFLHQNLEEFDADFFNISAREAPFVDPQQRLLMEVACEALEDAGIPFNHLEGSDTGVFIGAFTTDWQHIYNGPFNRKIVSTYSGINGSMTILSARLSYFFDLTGPCLTIDTACSSSLSSVHLACQSIWNGECALALCGGVNAMLAPETTIAMAKARVLSPEGCSRPFDAEAKGYVRGEGAGVVILKSLKQAISDHDLIYATIKGTGMNNDGRTQGITMPSREAQKRLINRVLKNSSIHPESISYVEAHGTGTSIGDPAEAWALNEVLSLNRKDKCFIGSVKSNFGHLEAAAGIAGLIKAALCLSHKKIPRHLHFQQPNAQIPLEKYCLKIPVKTEEFSKTSHVLRACVNSFGYGGTNAHVVLEAASQSPTINTVNQENQNVLMPLTAKSPEALKANARELSEFILMDEEIHFNDLAQTLISHRTHFDHRLVVKGNSLQDIAKKLSWWSEGKTVDDLFSGKILKSNPKIAFVYSGMGPQWWGMGQELLEHSSVFKQTIEECDRFLLPVSGWSLLKEMKKNEADSKLHEPEFAQPAQFALQAGLTNLLFDLDAIPHGIIGHSVGELAAAYAAKVLTLEEGILLSFHRSRLQAQRKGEGTMLAAGLTAAEAEEIIKQFPQDISLAAINSPRSVTLAGSVEALQIVCNQLEKKDIFNRFLKVSIAYHSHQMEGLESEVLSSLQTLDPQLPSIPLYSTVTGQSAHGMLLNNAYWWRNIREPVRFANGIMQMIEDDYTLFVEIGPHPVLLSAIKDCLDHSAIRGAAFGTLARSKHEVKAIQDCVANLFIHGVELNWTKIQPHAKGNFIRLPHYAWQRKKHWIETEESRQYRLSIHGHPMLSRRISTTKPTWQVEVNRHFFSWLHDHYIENSLVFPGAAYVEAGLCLNETVKGEKGCMLENIDFLLPFIIDPASEPLMQISYEPSTREFTVSSKQADEEWNWTLHSKGKILPIQTAMVEKPQDLIALKTRMDKSYTAATIYEEFHKKGMDYTSVFQSIEELWSGADEVLAQIKSPEDNESYFLHPAILDGAFQALIGIEFSLAHSQHRAIIPTHIDEFYFFNRKGTPRFCYGKVRRKTAHHIIADMTLYDEAGLVCTEIKGLYLRFLESAASKQNTQNFYSFSERECPLLSPPPPQDLSVCLITPHLDLREAIQAKWQMKGLTTVAEVDHSDKVVFLAESSFSDVKIELAQLLSLVELVKEISQKRPGTSTQLFIATTQASSLFGLGRVICHEYPDIHVKMIAFNKLDEELAEKLMMEMTDPSTESERRWDQQTRYFSCLENMSAEAYQKENTTKLDGSEPYALDLKQAGKIDHLFYQQTERNPPHEGEVEIRVHAASLNFKDLMKVLGILDWKALEETYFGTAFGMECSGTVIAVGKNVTNIKVGDQVCAFMFNIFRTYLTVSAQYVFPIPPKTSLLDAPQYIPFITVLKSLRDAAALKRGDSILIHSAAGAVGLAAIQYAKHVGAKIFATAGSEEKRHYLLNLGVDKVADSRSLSFAAELMAWTAGKGVDVVLNSLTGDALQKSWSVIASNGRFIEIGKKDIVSNASLPMHVFNRNATFTSIDLDRTFKNDPASIKLLVEKAIDFFNLGYFRPLPVESFPASEVSKAFQHMARARQIGKIMLKFEEEAVEGVLKKKVFKIDPAASYMITGGFGGFGLELAKWLAGHGASTLILIGRNGAATPQSRHTIAELRNQGVCIIEKSLDITSRDQVEKLFKEMRETLPPLKGIVHCAMVLDDGLIKDLNEDRVKKVFFPKAGGCINLHNCSLNSPLDFFILCSSISSLIGNPAQASYAAANAFLDAFALHRKSLGLPALSVNLGAVEEVGVVAQNVILKQHLENHGIHALKPAVILEKIEEAFNLRLARAGIMQIDWPVLVRQMPSLAKFSSLKNFISSLSQTNHNMSHLETEWRSMEDKKQLESIIHFLSEAVAGTLGTETQKMDIHAKLNTLGMDSLMAMELQQNLEGDAGIKIPTMELMKGPSIEELSKFLQKQLSK